MAYYKQDELVVAAGAMGRLKDLSDYLDGHFMALSSTFHSVDDGEWEFESA